LIDELQPADSILCKQVFYSKVVVHGQDQVGNFKVAGLQQFGINLYQAFGVFKLIVYLSYQFIILANLLV
jgi:hypothetical protein